MAQVKVTPIIERIERRSVFVDRGYLDECSIWPGMLRKGYGFISRGRRGEGYARVHRVVWEHYNGPIPADLEPDHLCEQKDCHRLSHLELVPHRENVLRGRGVAADNARKTHCKRGHEFTPVNTRPLSRGRRACRTCLRDYGREYMRRRRAA